ncbi:hypothetical protein IW15_00310 [Chryseobacterium soli]|uniref:Uncharacterized protein n=1 Tax=Chryseobacterium soli TaxID=445961 RepID=A0A086AB67_9FLAO|nr:hypothetical protein [Chryseobacterium soli]KFF13931.1 hypothetical protein IW15_00310 [Chryseobacterium soli]
MNYKDLLKISIYFIAIKLFVDSISRIPEKLYIAFSTGEWLINVISFIFLNFFIVAILIKVGNYFVDKIFSAKGNYINTSTQSIVEISMIICSYYIILIQLFSAIIDLFSKMNIDFNTVEKLTGIIISVFLIIFHKKISENLIKI